MKGHVPIIVGGHSPAAAKRAPVGDGFFPARGAPADVFAIAHEAAKAAGRDPKSLEITVSLPEKIEDFTRTRGTGVTRVLVPVGNMAGLAKVIAEPEDCKGWRDTLQRYASI